MRAIKNLNDVQIVLRDLLNNQTKQDTKALNRSGLQIKNMGPATEPNDAVTLSQLQNLIPAIPVADQNFTVVFSNAGSPSDSDVFAPYVFGNSRVGYPIEVWVQAVNAPTTGAFVVEIDYNGTSILTSNLTLPIHQNGPVMASNFVNPLPNFGYKGVLKGTVISANSAQNVSVGICVKRNTTVNGS